jgi:hypothetical protein
LKLHCRNIALKVDGDEVRSCVLVLLQHVDALIMKEEAVFVSGTNGSRDVL